MSLMSTEQVAEFLGVKVERVKRLAREHLLISKSQDDKGEPLFDPEDVKKYKELAERIPLTWQYCHLVINFIKYTLIPWFCTKVKCFNANC